MQNVQPMLIQPQYYNNMIQPYQERPHYHPPQHYSFNQMPYHQDCHQQQENLQKMQKVSPNIYRISQKNETIDQDNTDEENEISSNHGEQKRKPQQQNQRNFISNCLNEEACSKESNQSDSSSEEIELRESKHKNYKQQRGQFKKQQQEIELLIKELEEIQNSIGKKYNPLQPKKMIIQQKQQITNKINTLREKQKNLNKDQEKLQKEYKKLKKGQQKLQQEIQDQSRIIYQKANEVLNQQFSEQNNSQYINIYKDPHNNQKLRNTSLNGSRTLMRHQSPQPQPQHCQIKQTPFQQNFLQNQPRSQSQPFNNFQQIIAPSQQQKQQQQQLQQQQLQQQQLLQQQKQQQQQQQPVYNVVQNPPSLVQLQSRIVQPPIRYQQQQQQNQKHVFNQEQMQFVQNQQQQQQQFNQTNHHLNENNFKKMVQRLPLSQLAQSQSQTSLMNNQSPIRTYFVKQGIQGKNLQEHNQRNGTPLKKQNSSCTLILSPERVVLNKYQQQPVITSPMKLRYETEEVIQNSQQMIICEKYKEKQRALEEKKNQELQQLSELEVQRKKLQQERENLSKLDQLRKVQEFKFLEETKQYEMLQMKQNKELQQWENQQKLKLNFSNNTTNAVQTIQAKGTKVVQPIFFEQENNENILILPTDQNLQGQKPKIQKGVNEKATIALQENILQPCLKQQLIFPQQSQNNLRDQQIYEVKLPEEDDEQKEIQYQLKSSFLQQQDNNNEQQQQQNDSQFVLKIIDEKYIYEGKQNQLGQKHGFGVLRNIHGFVIYNGEWSNNRYHGHGVLYNEQPNILQQKFDYRDFTMIGNSWLRYEGDFINGNLSGQGTLEISNGEKIKGKFLEGKVHGQAQYYNLRGTIIQAIYREDKLIDII